MHVPKLIGADVEFFNAIVGLGRTNSGAMASKLLLSEFDGLPKVRGLNGDMPRQGNDPRRWGVRYLPGNGMAWYIDCHHLEAATVETPSAEEFVASFHATLQLAEEARQRAARPLRRGLSLEVAATTTDRQGNSFGSHINLSLTKRAFADIFHRTWQYLPWLATYHVSSLIFAGAGKVGAERGAPAAAFQLSERADVITQLSSVDTMANRGIVNRRDEPLAGSDHRFSRYHCICYDTNLQEPALYLKTGVLAIILTMIEAQTIDFDLTLRDPVEALPRISRDLTFSEKYEIGRGRSVTVVELQELFLEAAAQFVSAGRCAGIVAGAERIVALWADTLRKIRALDWEALALRLDWALKKKILDQVMARRPDLDWNSTQTRYADALYGNLNQAKGLFWIYRKHLPLERIVTAKQIDRARTEPPESTRAWTRAMLLRHADPDTVAAVDWDSIEFRRRSGNGRSFRSWRRLFAMDDPFGFTKAESGPAFRPGASLDEILDDLEARAPADGGPAQSIPIPLTKGEDHEATQIR